MPIQTFSGVIANQSTLLVNARELHERLQICTRFDIWIQRRISEYNFVENLDFIERSTLNNRGFFKTETKDYHLTLDMAKELCMLERSELGRQARRYFIEQEKEAKRLAEQNAKLLASIPPFLLSNPDQTAMLIGRAHQAFFLTYPETKDILRYREMGLTNPEIAKLLGLSKNTIERRLTKMFELGLTERRQAVNTQLSLGFMA
jgi:putative phage anti-repressor protein